MIAGSDTTATASANILYFLMSHPTAYKRLQAEVDGLGDKITDCSAQSQLPYLNAVMYVARFPKDKKIFILIFNDFSSHEGLRLLPPVLSGVQRAAEKGSSGRMVGSL
jgi:cytochrome P450